MANQIPQVSEAVIVDLGGAFLQIEPVRHGPEDQIGPPQPVGRDAIHDTGFRKGLQCLSSADFLEGERTPCPCVSN